ncbi:MAG: SDR family NAD(P)-dependent oxidoreductase [Myxococcota bacterium]
MKEARFEQARHLGLSGRAALVVGGGEGIGRATALALAENGAAVAVLDCERERAERVALEVEARGVRALAIGADVLDEAQVRRGLGEANSAFGGLDAVIDIVGGSSWGSLLEIDEATWERDFALNLKQHWYVARAAAQGWIEAGRPGAYCAVGSISGLFSSAQHGAYGAAKAGLLALVRTAAEEWWPHGIRVNAVVPGAVRTPRIEAGWSDGSVPRPDAETLERMALPEDVAGSILFLVSDWARKVTGQFLVVDGGSTTKFPYTTS